MEWCKLFADKNGKHYWGKIVTDKSKFETGLLELLKSNNDELDKYTNELRKCRDKFIAHLDSEMEDFRPFMDMALECSEYYYQYIITHENYFPEFPAKLNILYKECYELACKEYKK